MTTLHTLDEILVNLQSIATTNAQTLKSLQDLLGTQTVKPPKKIELDKRSGENATRKCIAAPDDPKPASAKSTKKAKPDAASFKIHENSVCHTKPLPSQKRRKAATDLFNASLKCLTNVVKARQNTKQSTIPCNAPKQAQSSKAAPLQPRSPNKQSKTRCVAAESPSDFGTVADCSISALDCLRQLEFQDKNAGAEVSQGLEKGALILIEKLISLDLSQRAVPEMSKLYDQYWNRKKSAVKSDKHVPDEREATLNAPFPMTFDTTSITAKDVTFIANYQSQGLRLAILLGSQAVTNTFVDNVKLTSKGSPADVIDEGHQKGYLSDEKAGEQLRTIAQALLKLYSVSSSAKQGCAIEPQLNFILLMEALTIKCKSWRLLKHEPDLDREYWTFVSKALKRLEANLNQSDHQTTEDVIQIIRDASTMFQTYNFASRVPLDVVHTLVDMAERTGDYQEALDLLSHCGAYSTRQCCQDRMLLNWRSLALQYKQSNMTDGQFLQHLRNVSELPTDFDDLAIDQIDNLLLYGARLRKTIILVVQSTTSEVQGGAEIQQYDFSILKCCLQILYGIAQVFGTIAHSLKKCEAIEKRRLALTAFAKTFEAIFDTTKQFESSRLSQQEESCIKLDHCVQIAKSLIANGETEILDNRVTHFIEDLLVQISNFYWAVFVEQKGQKETAEAFVKTIQASCSVVKGLSAKVQRSAAYNMKLEKLALSHLSSKEYGNACGAFEEVISHFIASGALKEAAETALKKQAVYVWHQSGTSRYSLGKAVVSLTKLRLTYGIVDSLSGSWILDIDDLSVLERSLLFDLQVSATTDHSFSLEEKRALVQHTRAILTSCSAANLEVYRLRFLNEMLRLTSLNRSCSEIVLVDPVMFKEVLESAAAAGDHIPLSSYKQPLQHLLWLQWLLKADQVDVNMLLEHVRSLCSIVANLKDSETFHSIIDDTDLIVRQLQAIVDFARTSGDITTMMSCISAVKHIFTLSNSSTGSQILNVMTQLADLYRRNGDILQSEKAFTAAEQWVEKCSEDPMAQAKWALSYIEYLLEVSDITKAMCIYDRVATLFDTANKSNGPGPGHKQLHRESLISRSALVASRIAFQTGNLHPANQFARQAAKISTQIWQAIERSQGEEEPPPTHDNDTSVQGLTVDLSNLTLCSDQSLVQRKSKGSKYWSYVDLHCATLQQMSDLSMHSGLYQDAVYYIDQLRKIAISTRSVTLITRALALSALVQAKSGHHEEAVGFLKGLGVSSAKVSCAESCESYLYQAETLVELERYAEAIAILDILDSFATEDRKPKESSTNSAVGIKKPPVRGKAKASRPIKDPAKRPGKTATAAVEHAHATSTDPKLTHSQRRVRERSSALRNQAALMQGRAPTALTYTKSGHALSISDSWMTVTNAMGMLRQAMSELSSDAVKCVLAETAVALPVRYRSSRKSGRVSFIQMAGSPAVLKKTRTVRGKAAVIKTANAKGDLSTGEKLILDAQKLLHDFQSAGRQICASDIMHVAYRLQSKLALLSSTMNVPLTSSSSELVFQSLVPKDVVQNRERLTIEAERATRKKSQILAWPDLKSINVDAPSSSAVDYGMDDLADIPHAWSIVTISLSDDQQELLVSKITGTRSPFMLRIPLSRSDCELDDENEFAFASAKAELMDIVTEANLSAHDSRGQGDREIRKAWYAEREELDRRLETWLYNIENIWFRGFRGLMSSTVFDEEVLHDFGQALNQILNKHLPSRQRSVAQKPNKVTLHAHVLELFLGLEDPDEQELDDAVTDLLYFVVDILQFSGEHNAYDEIDFDAMLVDVFDAMRVSSHAQASLDPVNRHTILIVDKEMACFPWESLQCLRTQSVSRMPSLGSVFCRLRRIQEQAILAQGYSISADDGAYILNPSSDLRSTQDTFQPIMHSQLPQYSSIVNRTPTESEIVSSLTTKQLLLYFGHGSGAQYVRGRTIRNLDHCAVTLLMGCSSAKMTECGKFESHGMPGYYIGGMSGCMAVVGTLWDVTDRDIDRFAMRTLVEWGLIYEDEDVAKVFHRSNSKNAVGRGKDKVKTLSTSDRRGTVSLDEAVNKARDACLLKYLNGAAPVVYGVPVFLQ